LAACRFKQDRYAEAESLSLKSLEILQQALEGPNLYEPDLHNNLGLIYEKQRRLDEAEERLSLAHSMYLNMLDPMDPRVGKALSNLGRVHHSNGNYTRAAAFYRRGLEIKEKTLGADHPDLVNTLTPLASIHEVIGDLDEALALAKRALKIAEGSYPPDHEAVDGGLDMLAFVHYSRGEYDLAEPLFEKSLEIRRKRLDPDHPEIAKLLSSIGSLYRGQERYAEALELQQKALKVLERDESTRYEVCLALHRLANLYRDMDKRAEAETTYLRSLHLYEEVAGETHAMRLAALKDYTDFLRSTGRGNEANKLIEEIMPKAP
jgi:tetratricopeptide (TPR) repeat protein